MLITNNAMNDNIISYFGRYFLNLFLLKGSLQDVTIK